jgi:hypothetical protein
MLVISFARSTLVTVPIENEEEGEGEKGRRK